MSDQSSASLEEAKAGFNEFYECLVPALVDFIEKMGVTPAHQVLKHAAQYVPYLERSLENMVVKDEEDRMWLLIRMGYFIGEYFAQQYGGCWYVNDLPGSRYFSRYVVGKFSKWNHPTLMIDPFEVSKIYVETPVPRRLENLLKEVERELKQVAEAS
jgi:hypothetical protein